jgi:hypothetical protein
MTVSLRLGARAVACVLGAALISAPCATAFSQGKAPASAKADKSKKKPSKAERAKARAAFEKGEEKFKSGDFPAAVEAFREANEIIPAAQAWYKIAVSLDKQGKVAEARDAYLSFLDFPPPEKMADQKAEVEARMLALSKGTIKLTTEPAGATVTIDGEPAKGPAPLALMVKPGKHKIDVSAPAYEPSTREVEVGAGATLEVTIPLAATPPPPPPPPVVSAPPVASAPPPAAPVKEQPPPSKVPAYVTLGLGGVGAVVGTIFGLQALSAKSDFKSKPTTDNADRAERNALIADMAFGVAVTLGITGTVLLLAGGDKPAEPAKAGQLRLSPVITPQTQGAAAFIRFLSGSIGNHLTLPERIAPHGDAQVALDSLARCRLVRSSPPHGVRARCLRR